MGKLKPKHYYIILFVVILVFLAIGIAFDKGEVLGKLIAK